MLCTCRRACHTAIQFSHEAFLMLTVRRKQVDLIFKRFDMLDEDKNGYLTPEETYLRMSTDPAIDTDTDETVREL